MNLDAGIEMLHPPAVRSGRGQVQSLAQYLSSQPGGMRPFVVTDAVNAARLSALGLDVPFFSDLRGEPKTEDLAAALDAARNAAPDVVVGFGGGSVMDLAKVIAVMAGSDLTLEELASTGAPPQRDIKLVQIPTTAGTGSEAGTRALIIDSATQRKMAFESPAMLADLVILDPELTVSLPPDLTAAVGIDALAHCVEAYTSKRAHPVIDFYALEGIRLVGSFLARAVGAPDDLQARSAMLVAAFYGGVCLGPVNTTAGHAVAYPLGTRYGIAHGLANALVFPHVLAFNAPCVPDKTRDICRALKIGDGDEDQIRRGASSFCATIGITRRLSDFGIRSEDLQGLAEEAHAIRRLLDYNPRDISVEQITEIYRAAY